jgi:hypothetical protein
LLVGSAAVGSSLPLAAYPLIASAFGTSGLRIALLVGVANSLAVWLAGGLLFATAGAAFPERYEHVDGGTYRGEWLGMLKQGHGVYTYPSGARYEGGWHRCLSGRWMAATLQWMPPVHKISSLCAVVGCDSCFPRMPGWLRVGMAAELLTSLD